MAKQIQELEYRLTATDAGASKVFERASERAARIERQAVAAGNRAEEAIRRSARDSRTLDPSQRNAGDKTALADMAEYYRKATAEANKLYEVDRKRAALLEAANKRHAASGMNPSERDALAGEIRRMRREADQYSQRERVRERLYGQQVATTAAAATEARQTWKEFVGARMGQYMRSEGGHGPAMQRLGREWKEYQAGRLAEQSGAEAAKQFDQVERHRSGRGLTGNERAALARRYRDIRAWRSASDPDAMPEELRIATSTWRAPVSRGSRNPITRIAEQAEKFNKLFNVAGAGIIADRVGRSLQRLPEITDQYRESLKNGYTKSEAAGQALAELVPGAGELAKGFRAAYDWLADLAKSDLLKETEARQKDEKERAAALGEASQKRGLASREVIEDSERDIRRSRRGRMEDQDQAAHDQAVEDARAEYATTKARTDISPEAKEAARQRMVETEGAAFEELNKKRQAQETQRIEELAAFEIGAQEEIVNLRRQADEEAMEREGRGHELRVKQINDEAEQQIRAAQERYQEFTAKHKDAASYGVTPELQERQIAGIRAVRDQRVAKEQQAAEREQQEAALAEAQRYAQESLEQAQEADAQWRRAGRIDGPRVYGAEQAMAGITGGEAGGDSLKAQQSMDKKMSESVTLLKQVVEQLRQQLQALNDPKRPLIVVSQGGAQ
jgi:hypothetical protein